LSLAFFLDHCFLYGLRLFLRRYNPTKVDLRLKVCSVKISSDIGYYHLKTFSPTVIKGFIWTYGSKLCFLFHFYFLLPKAMPVHIDFSLIYSIFLYFIKLLSCTIQNEFGRTPIVSFFDHKLVYRLVKSSWKTNMNVRRWIQYVSLLYTQLYLNPTIIFSLL
jgi:hypothetical protein